MFGNTPTHVGKTVWASVDNHAIQKHPHARGEDDRAVTPARKPGETPPRTWGRQANEFSAAAMARNTPTHVGKTQGKAFPEKIF